LRPFASALSRKIETGPPNEIRAVHPSHRLDSDIRPIRRFRRTDEIAFTRLARSPNARLVISGDRKHERESRIKPDLFMDHHAPRERIILSLVCLLSTSSSRLPRAALVLPRAFFRETSRTSRLTCNGVEINILLTNAARRVSEMRGRISREEIQLYTSMDHELQLSRSEY